MSGDPLLIAELFLELFITKLELNIAKYILEVRFADLLIPSYSSDSAIGARRRTPRGIVLFLKQIL